MHTSAYTILCITCGRIAWVLGMLLGMREHEEIMQMWAEKNKC